ncbi:MAG: putative methyltransferase, partial [uncultured Thermomicrobiales bacterium]
ARRLGMGRDALPGQRPLLRARPPALRPRARGPAGGRPGPRRTRPPDRCRLRSRHRDPAAGAPLRRGGGRRPGPGDAGGGRAPRGRGRDREHAVGAGAGGGPPRRPGHLPRRDVRPVLPLDGPEPRRRDRPRHARAGRRTRPRERRQGWPGGTRRRLAPPGPAVHRDRRVGAAVPGRRAAGRAGGAAARHSGRRGGGAERGRVPGPGAPAGSGRRGAPAVGGRRRGLGLLAVRLGAAPVRGPARRLRGRPPPAARRRDAVGAVRRAAARHRGLRLARPSAV